MYSYYQAFNSLKKELQGSSANLHRGAIGIFYAFHKSRPGSGDVYRI
jgi:hypothetical protein